MKKILVLGIGHWLMGDDSLGPQVIRELKKLKLPAGVELAEVGPAVMDALPLLENKDKIIIVDALKADESPGTILRISAEEILSSDKEKLSLHQVNIVDVLKLSAQMGTKVDAVIIGLVIAEQPFLKEELSELFKKKLPSLIQTIIKELSSANAKNK